MRPDIFESTIDQLRVDLTAPLPGRTAQYAMAPLPQAGNRLPYDAPPAAARRSAVLILLYPHAGQIYLPLIVRPQYDGVHSGQVSFPGGRFEEVDGDLATTALRETYEEIGVEPATVQVLGELTWLYILASNSIVQPFLAVCRQRPTFQLDHHEVSELLEVPVVDLLEPRNCYSEVWQLRDRTATVPFYALCNQKIWGATAMMLSELLSLPAIHQLTEPRLNSALFENANF